MRFGNFNGLLVREKKNCGLRFGEKDTLVEKRKEEWIDEFDEKM